MKISFPLFLFLILLLVMFNPVFLHANPSLSLTVKTDNSVMYLGTQQEYSGSTVQVSGNLTFGGTPTTNGLVGIEVDNSGVPLVMRTLPASQPPSLTPYVFTWYVEPCTASGTITSSFEPDTLAYFEVDVENFNYYQSYPVYVSVNVYDSTGRPWGVEEFYETLTANSSSLIIISFPISPHAALGTATVYADAYSNWPSLGGTPYVREVSASFQIADCTPAAEQLIQNQSANLQSTDTSNYNTAFTLAPFATPGQTYVVYVTSSYQGQSASNSTTFTTSYGPPHIAGDLGSRVGSTNEFFAFDHVISAVDLSLFLQCYHGTAPTAAMHLGDLGSRVGSTNEFFAYGYVVSVTDLSLFLECYHGIGPTGPVAIFTWSPLKPASDQHVTFNASQSYDDKYGTVASYAWNFGDGNTTTVTNPIVQHTFTSPGNYTVTLLVTDSNLQPSLSTSNTISVIS
jgi:hypothetical protein